MAGGRKNQQPQVGRCALHSGPDLTANGLPLKKCQAGKSTAYPRRAAVFLRLRSQGAKIFAHSFGAHFAKWMEPTSRAARESRLLHLRLRPHQQEGRREPNPRRGGDVVGMVLFRRRIYDKHSASHQWNFADYLSDCADLPDLDVDFLRTILT